MKKRVEPINLVIAVTGILLGIVGYFLKLTMDDLKEAKKDCFELKIKVEVIESDYNNKHNHLNEKFDTLNETMKTLIMELKALNIELLKKKF